MQYMGALTREKERKQLSEEFKCPLKKRPLAGIVAEFFPNAKMKCSHTYILTPQLTIGFCFLFFFLITGARASTYALDQERRFEWMITALENHGQAAILDVDPEIEAFVNGITYSLQKTLEQQRASVHRHLSAYL